MPRLFLLRHAKSPPAVPGQKDFDRPLAARGRAAAPAVGRHMADKGYLPDLVLCSPSARTRETLDGSIKARLSPPMVDVREPVWGPFGR